jgi:hypothetical protein
VVFRRECFQIAAYFGKKYLSREDIDTVYHRHVDPQGPLPLGRQVELRLILAPRFSRLPRWGDFGFCRSLVLRYLAIRQSCHMLLQPLVTGRHLRLVEIIGFHYLLQLKQYVRTPVPLQTVGDLVLAGGDALYRAIRPISVDPILPPEWREGLPSP